MQYGVENCPTRKYIVFIGYNLQQDVCKINFFSVSLDLVFVMAIPCSLINAGIFLTPILNGITSDCGTSIVCCFFFYLDSLS